MNIPEYLQKAMALPEERRRAALRALSDRGVNLARELPPASEAVQVPLSPQQRDLWTHEALYPGASLNLCGAYWFTERVEADALGGTILALSERHAILRMRLLRDESDVLQHVSDDLVELDIRNDVEAPEQARALIERFAATPFDLSREAPMRALLLCGPGVDHGVLVMAFHHIVTDWWSFDLLHQEFATVYEAIRAGKRPPANNVSDYRGFACWWRELQELGVWDKELSFWTDKLRDLPEPLFGTGTTDASAERVDMELGKDARALIKSAARRLGQTPSSVTLACFGMLMTKVNGKSDLVVGTPSANRDIPGTAQMLGYVMNMVPVRLTDLDELEPDDAIHRVASEFRMAIENGKVPLGQITARVAPARKFGRAPIYQAAFMYLPEQESGNSLPGHARFERVHTGAEENDFVAILRERGNTLDLTFEFRTGAVSYDTAMSWVSEFEQLIVEFLTPRASITGVANASAFTSVAQSLVSGPERFWPAQTLPEIVRLGDPESIALVSGAEAITFAEVEAISERLAGSLRANGVGRGDAVGLHLRRGRDIILMMVAALKVGAAYVPLDPSYPPERLEAMVRAANVSLIIEHHSDPYVALSRTHLDVGEMMKFTAPSMADSAGVPGGDDIAYVMFTSGSTGIPKGVPITHRAAVNLAFSQSENFRISPADSMLQFATVNFDASVEEIWAAWAGGARVVVGAGLTDGSIREFCGFVQDNKVTILDLPTAMWEVLAHSTDSWFSSDLRLVVIGGDTFSINALRKWSTRFPGVTIINTYGPTEATVSATSVGLTLAKAIKVGQIIGEPIANVKLTVVDPAGRTVPRGAEGELVIGGVGVSPGYLAGAGSDAGRFETIDGARSFRSGDRARMSADGQLVYLGRLDSQVKVRGFRVEPDAVERALTSDTGVDSVAVVLRGASQGAHLVAFFVGDTTDIAELSRAATALPVHERPSSYIPLASMPLTPSGKWDRIALQRDEGDTTPTSGLELERGRESEIGRIWSRYLGIPMTAISSHSNFFDLGGTSLTAIAITHALSDVLGREVAARDLYENPTPAELASMAEAPSVQPITAHLGPREGMFPLMPTQRGLRYQCEIEQSVDPYVVVDVWNLDRGASGEQVRSAIRMLVARHESLRTTFPITANGAVQQVHAWMEPSISTIDSRHKVPLSELVEGAARTEMSLEKGPLLHAWTVGENGVDTVIIALHHLVTDGRSMGILHDEFDRILQGRRLATPSVQPADVAMTSLATGQFDEMRSAWVASLAGVSQSLSLPWDRERPQKRSSAGHQIVLETSADLRADLARTARENGTTTYTVLLAGFEATLHALSGTDDLLVGVSFGGRLRSETSSSVGYFVNGLPVRSRRLRGQSFSDFIRETHRALLDTSVRQSMPFDDVVRAVNPSRDPRSHPLFQVMFNHEPDDSKVEQQVDVGLAKYDLAVTVLGGSNGESLRIRAEWRSDIIDIETGTRWTAAYISQLAQAVAHPERPWSAAVRGGIMPLAFADATPQDGSSVDDIIRIIAKNVADYPNAPAVQEGENVMTYGQLGAWATEIAEDVRRAGLHVHGTVAVLAKPSATAYAAALGALVAQRRFLFIEPDTPQNRVEHMVRDADVELFLTATEHGSTYAGRKSIALREPTSPPAISDFARWGTGVDIGSKSAYVCYTSGTSGAPKGVNILRGSLSNNAMAMGEAMGLRRHDRVLHFASLAFDASIFEIFGTLSAGAAIVCCDPERRVGPLLQEQLIDQRVSFAVLPPTVIAQLDPEAVPDLKTLVTAGERCPAWLIERWGDGRLVFNAYGPTEATVAASVGRLTSGRPVSAGNPIAGALVSIRDDVGSVVPADFVGEVLIGGSGVAAGYLNRPVETERAFVTTDAGRAYRSGDLGRIRADGSLELLGRIDDQLKFRGVRLEPAEVEGAAVLHPGVRQAALVLKTVPDRTDLVLYCATKDAALVASDVRGVLQTHLPRTAMPTHIVICEQLPMTRNGKLDRDALALMDLPPDDRPPVISDDPISEAMQKISRAWADVLGGPMPGPDDNFFDLGGDSIRMVEVAVRLRPENPTQILIALYSTQTVRGVALAYELEEIAHA